MVGKKMDKILDIKMKQERGDAEAELVAEIVEALEEEYPECEGDVKNIVHDIHKEEIRKKILKKKVRVDGRKTNEIRKITAEVSVLPRVHGSSLFTRGETQALVVTTLGSSRDAQLLG